MEIGVIGIGRMGSGIVRRLLRAGHKCVVYDHNRQQLQDISKNGATLAEDLEEFTRVLKPPRVVWIMVPAETVDNVISRIAPLLAKDDIVIDGGNSFYKDDVRRARALRAQGIHYMDIGTSGGIYGEKRGFCLMCGGEKSSYLHIEPLLKDLAPGVGLVPRTQDRKGKISSAENGHIYCGPAGAGHFVKMIHNGIEYGMMASLAEGLNILKGANMNQYDFNLVDITEVWRRGSVVSSWLLDLTAEALANDPELGDFSGHVADSGEARWTIQTAIDEGIPTPTLSAALFERFSSQGKATFGDQVLSAMRFKFGGHIEKH